MCPRIYDDHVKAVVFYLLNLIVCFMSYSSLSILVLFVITDTLILDAVCCINGEKYAACGSVSFPANINLPTNDLYSLYSISVAFLSN